MNEARERLERLALAAITSDERFVAGRIRWGADGPEHLALAIELSTPDGLPARLELIERRSDPGEIPPERYWYALHSHNARGERLYQGHHYHREGATGTPIAHCSERVEGARARWAPEPRCDAAAAVGALLAGYEQRERLRPAPLPARDPGETMRAYRRRKMAAAALALF